MKSDHRLNIGFFTCHLDNDYAFEICKGVEYAAREADVNLIIFPGMYLNASYNDPVNAKYDYQYNSIFYYASQKTLDALIVSIGSIGSFLSVDDIHSFLRQFNIPILALEIPVEGYSSLYTDSKPGMREEVEHMIKHHGKTKIGFVSGRKENDDAQERLAVYRQVLEENNIPYDPKLVVYGDFSEYSERIVDRLLNNNPDLEAVIFANDTMTIGGYLSIMKHGRKIGKDILVAGFDNAPVAVSHSPSLTTVDNKIMELGYNSIYQTIDLIKDKKQRHVELPSSLIVRNSCGCNPSSDPEILERVNAALPDMDPAGLRKEFKDLFLSHYYSCFYSERLFELLDPFILRFTTAVFQRKSVTISQLLEEFHTLLDDEVIRFYFSYMKVANMLRVLADFLSHLNIQAARRVKLNAMLNAIQSELAFTMSRELNNATHQHKSSIWGSVYITRDTLISSGNESLCFSLIMDKLYHNSGFQSSYIYLYDKTATQLPNGTWQIPDYVMFQASMLDGKVTVFSGDDRILPSSMIFQNKYTPNSRRHTLTITPIFTNEVQHGLFVSETSLQNFSQVYSTTLQLGTSMKFMELMRQQIAIQNRLESSMNEIREKNDLLNHLSITDPLTGLYNHRGFFEAAQELITSSGSRGCPAVIGYVDMDNLKQVNDIFGHKEGDFALRAIADTLRTVMPEDAIIARIGGDEFAICAINMDSGNTKKLKDSMNKQEAKLNRSCGKPYYIECSIGLVEFDCSSGQDSEELMIKADEKLYINKRRKRKNVVKEESKT
ncbi:MAG: GGDEF domain-containing protein [Eubacterium sp.]|nr:GGDEF domain-containing protein [Eubacterium sp.]